MNEHLVSPPCKILEFIFKREQRKTQTNGQENKKADYNAHSLTSRRDDIDRLCVSRKEGRSEFTSIKDNVGVSIRGLKD